ncbi:MAG: hypothetical protein FWF53_02345, partial [Candidatus Azobacteroides sp.]|nr:hypothetical protein [Candidatus Azobacteroides sp.]
PTDCRLRTRARCATLAQSRRDDTLLTVGEAQRNLRAADCGHEQYMLSLPSPAGTTLRAVPPGQIVELILDAAQSKA